METDDGLLAKLLTLGFEIEACNKVIQEGFTNANDAIERLLAKKSENDDAQLFDDQSPDVKNSEKASPQKLVKSRCEASEEQQQIIDDFHARNRLEAHISYQKDRKEKHEAKKRVLQQIEQDKIERKEALKSHEKLKDNLQTKVSEKVVSSKKPNVCNLSIRFPSGKAQKLEFESDTPLKKVVFQVFPDYFETDDNIHYTILQPFPRRVLNDGDMLKTLFDLNLCPSSVLVIQCSELRSSSRDTTSESMDIDQSVECKKTLVDDSEKLPKEIPSDPLCSKSRQLSSIKTEENKTKETRDCSMEIAESAHKYIDNPELDKIKVNCSKSRLINMSPNSNTGEDLNAKNVEVRSPERSRPNRQFLEAMNQRKGDMHQKTDANLHHVRSIHRDIPSLQLTCANCIAKHLSHLTSVIVNSIHKLKYYQAKIVIQSLKDMRLLNPKLVHLFIPCRLQEMILDYYLLCTNELVEKIRWHTSLRKLSLVSSPFITDHSLMLALRGLPKLEYLNLTSCEKLTSKVLETIQGLLLLKVLILDKVKISTDRLNAFLKNAPNLLQQLSLNECPIMEDAFKNAKNLTSLTSLSLRGTKVSACHQLSNFPNLSFLSLQKTPVSDNGIAGLPSLKNLKVLELVGTDISTEGLSKLQGLHLQKLSLPSRLTTDNTTIQAIHGLPLTTLDLTDHININDSALPLICQIKSLVYLSLSNTKVTDKGVQLLTALKELEVLDLSRCHLSDDVASVFSNLKIHTLNLSQTKISDDSMLFLSKCTNLQKLNLSRTLVTDKGCLHLKLPYLNSLFFDYTDVSWEGVQLCISNCGTRGMLVRNAKYNILVRK